ncbi:metallophosphoesterase [Ignavibacteria bacterium]|nr:metallophosphoesterase [Bacteroidota bacterium]MCZ2131625.1 tartrate-resistant acid phosphatase type 5 family protein [Bacteroidota bacterium]
MDRRFFLKIAAMAGAAQYGSASKAFSFAEVTASTGETNPPPPIRFFIIGDWGTGGKLQREAASGMARKATAIQPQFILSTGDNIYPKGVDSPDDAQWKTKFENIYVAEQLQIPWYAVLGNHDYRSNPDAQIEYGKINQRWNMPARYYSFGKKEQDCSVEFFAIDTQQILLGKGSEQLKWLEKKLAASKADWKIGFGHIMIRSHGYYGDQPFMLKTVKPLFDKYKADAYFCGHDHDLQCIKHPDDNFYQIISGAGGGTRVSTPGKYSLFASGNGGFVYCAATKNSLTVEFLDRNGNLLYTEIIKK